MTDADLLASGEDDLDADELAELAELASGSGAHFAEGRAENFQRPGPRGQCVVCQAAVEGARWYCDEHKPKRTGKHRAKSSTSSTAARSTSSARRTPPAPRSPAGGFAKVSDNQAATAIARLLIIITVMVMTYSVRRHRMADPNGEIANELALTDAEAKAFARPVARWGNSTNVGARVIGPIARNEDIIDFFYAGWQYQRRVNAFWERYERGGLAPVQPIRAASAPAEPHTRAEDQVIEPDEPLPEQFRAVGVPYDPAAGEPMVLG